MRSTSESVKDRQEGQTGQARDWGGEEGEHREQYRFNLFVHLIFKDLVLFVTAFQLGSHFISLQSGLHHLGTNKALGHLG